MYIFKVPFFKKKGFESYIFFCRPGSYCIVLCNSNYAGEAVPPTLCAQPTDF